MQDTKSPYPTMAPIEQYRMDRDAEIALARTAAPASISRDAEILGVGQKNFETAVKGKNGFLCVVGRAFAGAIEQPGVLESQKIGAHAIVPLGHASLVFEPQSKIQGQLGRDAPGILDVACIIGIRGGVIGEVVLGHRGRDSHHESGPAQTEVAGRRHGCIVVPPRIGVVEDEISRGIPAARRGEGLLPDVGAETERMRARGSWSRS